MIFWKLYKSFTALYPCIRITRLSFRGLYLIGSFHSLNFSCTFTIPYSPSYLIVWRDTPSISRPPFISMKSNAIHVYTFCSLFGYSFQVLKIKSFEYPHGPGTDSSKNIHYLVMFFPTLKACKAIFMDTVRLHLRNATIDTDHYILTQELSLPYRVAPHPDTVHISAEKVSLCWGRQAALVYLQIYKMTFVWTQNQWLRSIINETRDLWLNTRNNNRCSLLLIWITLQSIWDDLLSSSLKNFYQNLQKQLRRFVIWNISYNGKC